MTMATYTQRLGQVSDGLTFLLGLWPDIPVYDTGRDGVAVWYREGNPAATVTLRAHHADSLSWADLNLSWICPDGGTDRLFAPARYDHLDRLHDDLVVLLGLPAHGRPTVTLGSGLSRVVVEGGS